MELSITQKRQIVDQVDKLIKNYSIEELVIVNKMIVERIKHLQKTNTLFEMAKFRIGDVVSFKAHDKFISGRIIKFNQKTISILSDDNVLWNVSPKVLMKKA
jgi:hypothetical protein